MQHTLFCTFLCRCFARLQRATSRNFLSYTFYGGNVVWCSRSLLVSLPPFFTLHWWPLAFLILSPPLQNFHVVLPTKKYLLCFFSRSKSLSPFFSLSFAALPPTVSFSLSFSCSIFQICGHDNLSKLNTLDNTDTETISSFRFRLYWLFCCLCFTRRRWLCDFPPKWPRIAFGLPYLLIELFYIGMPVVRTAGLSGGRSVYGHVITKFSRMGRFLRFLSFFSAKNGANWTIRLVRFLLRSRYENATPNLCWVFCTLLGVLCN